MAALLAVPFPGGRYESETRHLKSCLRRGVRIDWVSTPALYAESTSSFRPVRDTVRVLVELIR